MLPEGFLPYWQMKVLNVLNHNSQIKLVVSRYEFNRRAIKESFIVPTTAICELPGRDEKPFVNQEGWVNIEVVEFQIESGMITIRLPKPEDSTLPDEHYVLRDMLPTHLFRTGRFKP